LPDGPIEIAIDQQPVEPELIVNLLFAIDGIEA
jgi:hypothetical protein